MRPSSTDWDRLRPDGTQFRDSNEKEELRDVGDIASRLAERCDKAESLVKRAAELLRRVEKMSDDSASDGTYVDGTWHDERDQWLKDAEGK